MLAQSVKSALDHLCVQPSTIDVAAKAHLNNVFIPELESLHSYIHSDAIRAFFFAVKGDDGSASSSVRPKMQTDDSDLVLSPLFGAILGLLRTGRNVIGKACQVAKFFRLSNHGGPLGVNAGISSTNTSLMPAAVQEDARTPPSSPLTTTLTSASASTTAAAAADADPIAGSFLSSIVR